ncbi:centriole, cilia and spindle-associated protein [Tachysurus fulvidraco]|uniref:centriole, cilia and spindle-associated protein n=1 Tax=Tachysurus fulvidraco TaxID=1234273 RepID=UPI001FEDEF26|nr:centriole, cilia and spindle-associated protein [Tachysurus fulvidraco]XP_047659336.1 centriole, cilia and spindle-associated protein [Tachysurus fulvidraco]
MTSTSIAATKKVRSEYMKMFREPKWETFSKCYQDSVKYRLSRRLMEQTHRPLFVDGWDSGSDSSGRSSPRVRGTTESSNPHPSSSESADIRDRDTDTAEHEQKSLPVENGYQHVTANGPSEQKLRHRAPRSPQGDLDTDESTDYTLKKPTRAKSQPPAGAAERTSNRDNRRSNIRYDWTERSMEARERRRLNMKGSASAGEIHRADVGVQTRRDSEKREKVSDRRRTRSADLEKFQRTKFLSADDRWMTEYMRCFSARLSCCSQNGLDQDETKRLPLYL